MKKFGFTLIELLVVIGILSILAVALLLAINPAEAQRKARDTQRLKDVSNLQAALEGWINDHPGSTLNITTASTVGGVANRDCGTGWLALGGGSPINVCNYINKLPVDPRNVTNGRYADSETSDVAGALSYGVRVINNDYHLCTRFESKSNYLKTNEDGILTPAAYFDVFSSTTTVCP